MSKVFKSSSTGIKKSFSKAFGKQESKNSDPTATKTRADVSSHSCITFLSPTECSGTSFDLVHESKSPLGLGKKILKVFGKNKIDIKSTIKTRRYSSSFRKTTSGDFADRSFNTIKSRRYSSSCRSTASEDFADRSFNTIKSRRYSSSYRSTASEEFADRPYQTRRHSTAGVSWTGKITECENEERDERRAHFTIPEKKQMINKSQAENEENQAEVLETKKLDSCIKCPHINPKSSQVCPRSRSDVNHQGCPRHDDLMEGASTKIKQNKKSLKSAKKGSRIIMRELSKVFVRNKKASSIEISQTEPYIAGSSARSSTTDSVEATSKTQSASQSDTHLKPPESDPQKGQSHLLEQQCEDIQNLTFEIQSSPKAKDYDEEIQPEFHRLEQLETGEKLSHVLSENGDKGCPRHRVGCTPFECHGALMEKNGFGTVSNSDAMALDEKFKDASHFITQFAQETGLLDQDQLEKRLERIKHDLTVTGTYVHTHDELEFGCRLAWRNTGRCIMRKVSFTLELRDCRKVTTAEACFQQCVKHLKYAFNEGAIKPVISVFSPKSDGESAPVRIWNRQLLGYAAYKRKDGSIMGDPVNLGFTALCMKFGWEPPFEKSDFDVLPWLISDEHTGHDSPKVFEIPSDAVEEIEFEHPDFDLFETLNLRWYALPCISNIGLDIGGVYYQTSPFNGWYQITEIARDLLDKQRYDLTELVAAACDIPKTTLSLWRDDAQLQLHKAILHSFAKRSISCVDHHTASDTFLDFYSSEVKKRGKCPADWVWLVPPAGGSMTGVFHQEMFNFILKPQYRIQTNVWDDMKISLPEPVVVDTRKNASAFKFDKELCMYDDIYIYYGSETGKSLKFATMLESDFVGNAAGPMPLDDLPSMLANKPDQHTLVLVVTSTFGKGKPPASARKFVEEMTGVEANSVKNVDFGVLALGNSAYTESFVAFGYEVESLLKLSGCNPIMRMKIADELKNQEGSFQYFRSNLFNEETGLLYLENDPDDIEPSARNNKAQDLATMTFIGTHGIMQREAVAGVLDKIDSIRKEKFNDNWDSHTHKLGRSIDLFKFKVDSEWEMLLEELVPGDHIALYPSNMRDVVESVLRNVDTVDRDATRQHLTSSVDLSRPLGSCEISKLCKLVQDQDAKMILDMILSYCTRNNMPSIERLVQVLPPGSIPLDWIMECGPSMDPRFYSIASISRSEHTVSIAQSIYTFEATNKAGVTSRWLRNLNAGEKVTGTFATTDFHLPDNQESPVVMISTGSGIAPFRAFWLSERCNPLYLFYGCRDPSELPFASEIDQLEKKGMMQSYIAYSRVVEGKMRLDEKMKKERGQLLKLLHDKRTTIYLCGSPGLEVTVRNALIQILAEGDKAYPGLGISRSVDRLVIMQQTKRLIQEVYGTDGSSSDPIVTSWQESTAKIVRNMSEIQRLGVPLARVKAMDILRKASGRRNKQRRRISELEGSFSNWDMSTRFLSSGFAEDDEILDEESRMMQNNRRIEELDGSFNNWSMSTRELGGSENLLNVPGQDDTVMYI